ncbi:hypothetical protein ABPG72_021908 [Tetrahymena utriculariae]
MAKETEGKELNQQEVTNAIDTVYKNPNIGFFLVGATNQEDKAISSELITFSHDIYRASNVWWFQSVFVEKQYRGSGVFKGMFHEVEKINTDNQYPLRLYVENENTRAQQVYQRLGMFDSSEIFIEDDFYFDDKIVYKHTNEFIFSLADIQQAEQFKNYLKNSALETLMNKQITSIYNTLKSIDFIIQQSDFGGIFVVKNSATSKIVGYLPVFYEISDWRNGIMIYIYDFRILQELKEKTNLLDLVSSFMHFLKKSYNPKIRLTNIRWIIDELCPFKNTIAEAGLKQGHYRVYEKNKF